MNKDAVYVIVGGFVRSVAVSLISVTYGLYVAFLGFSPAELGILIAAGLIGLAAATAIVLFWGDRIGRRKLLIFLALLGALGGIATSYATNLTLFIVSGFVGMLNGMGRDRGPAAALDQSILATIATDRNRTKLFAIYTFTQDLGHAIGSGLAALPVLFQRLFEVNEEGGYQTTIIIYSVILFLSGLFATRLSKQSENHHQQNGFSLARETRQKVWKLSALFGVDALGSGFLTGSLIAYYFHERYGLGAAEVGGLIAAARISNALSHFGAAWIASKIGLIRTMVFTHFPAHFLLVAMGFAPEFWMAAVLYLLHESLVEMDVPTRQSYVMAIIQPRERTAVASITQLVRVAGWGLAPAAAGALMGGLALAMPLFAGSAIKAIYDIGLYFSFRSVPAPEETKAQ